MKVLDLPLKKEWYNMIESGEKREEYRELKPYWCKRLLHYSNLFAEYISIRDDYTHVRFRYGYTKRTMLYKIDTIDIGLGKPEWGAPKDENVFIIKLGERVKGDKNYAIAY